MIENINTDTKSKYYSTFELSETFNCSLERAFKTPILGDAKKILIGYCGFKLVKGFIKDKTWSNEGGSRVPILTIFGEMGIDEIFIRQENQYWKWGVSQFNMWIFFATKSIGEWWCKDNQNGKITVIWKYTWYSKNWFFHPINWLMVKVFWSKVMRNGMKTIKSMAESDVPYCYNT